MQDTNSETDAWLVHFYIFWDVSVCCWAGSLWCFAGFALLILESQADQEGMHGKLTQKLSVASEKTLFFSNPPVTNLNLAAVGLMFPVVSHVIIVWHFCSLNSALLCSIICCLMGNYFWGSTEIEVEFLESRSWCCGSFISLAVEKVVPNVHKGYKEHLYIPRFSIFRLFVF